MYSRACRRGRKYKFRKAGPLTKVKGHKQQIDGHNNSKDDNKYETDLANYLVGSVLVIVTPVEFAFPGRKPEIIGFNPGMR